MKKENISQRATQSLDDIASEKAPEYAERSYFDIQPELAKIFKQKGLKARWLSLKKLKENGGVNKSDWTPLRESHLDGLVGSDIGTFNAEGFFVRGDMVLSVKSEAKYAAHKAKLEAAANRASNKANDDASALKAKARAAGGGVSGKGLETGKASSSEG